MSKKIFSVLLVMGPVLTFGYLGEPIPMTISLFAGFASAVFLNIDSFESFKAGQLEAKLREADEVIKEANATIDELKEISEPLMDYLLAHIVRGNTIIGISGIDKEKLLISLTKNYKKFDIGSERSESLLEEANKTVEKSYFDEIGIAIDGHMGWERSEPFRVWRDSYRGRQLPEPEEIRNFVREQDFDSDNVTLSINEYERFRTS